MTWDSKRITAGIPGSDSILVGSCLNQVAPDGEVRQPLSERLGPTPSTQDQAARESEFFTLAMPGILDQHAFAEYRMWRKHLYGTIYGEKPPSDNPLLSTQAAVANYLNTVADFASPGGILIYWRSQPEYRSASQLCVGLALSDRRMLVEASPVADASTLTSLLRFDRVSGARVAIPRSGPSEPRDRDAAKPMDLVALSRALLPPTIAAALSARRVKSLLVVPIQAIGSVPFAALPLPSGGTVIDYSSVTMAPGISGLRFGGDATPRTITTTDAKLIIGDPDLTTNSTWIFPPLPGARQEAQTVAGVFGERALIGRAATRKAVVTRLTARPTPRLIYFATHAIADQVNPQDASFLALTGANLRTREIGKLRLSGRPLVVLSACQTGLGKVFDEGGIFGMALAWHYAGAGAVVMSLWNVPDLPTRDLMTEFSRRLQTETPSEALAGSMRMLKQRDSLPNHWAGFTVYGGLPHRSQ